MEGLSERVVKLERDLIKLKTNQKTQNDSFMYYSYQSENLVNRTWASIDVEFIPNGKKREDVVCRFIASDGTAVQTYELIAQSPTDSCKAVAGARTETYSSAPSFMRFYYIICETNCKGELKLTFN